jgi:hypothetical protein
MGLYPLLVADYFSPAAHHEKGGCTSASPDRRPTPSPPIYIFDFLQINSRLSQSFTGETI